MLIASLNPEMDGGSEEIRYTTGRKRPASTRQRDQIMNRLAAFYELYLFEDVSEEQYAPGQTRRWSNIQQGKRVPYAFIRNVLLTIDAVLLVVAGLIGFTTPAPMITIVVLEILYLGACMLLFLARTLKQFLSSILAYLAAFSMGLLLNLLFPGMLESVYFYILCVIISCCFPLRWALPFAALCILALTLTHRDLLLLPFPHPGNGQALASTLALICLLCWLGWTRRTQSLLMMKLQETQGLLREQMVRGEVLAAERERTRIARDIHDVLSHSLAILSIQVQAARHLRTRDPERLAAKLDDMATLIRESITESRRVVGLLREPSPQPSNQDDPGTHLSFIATTFGERTGIHCRFEESGTPHRVSPQQKETLELALREMLTNAHRHGAAQTIWITVRWREASIIVEAHDDGMGADTTQSNTLTRKEGGHHGLQGMRERAIALGGEVEAGPVASGGFLVRLRLPFEPSHERAARRGKEV
jgi:signal transduction histidine kinase